MSSTHDHRHDRKGGLEWMRMDQRVSMTSQGYRSEHRTERHSCLVLFHRFPDLHKHQLAAQRRSRMSENTNNVGTPKILGGKWIAIT